MTWRDNYRRKTAYVTISLPFDLLWKIGDMADKNSWSRSYTIGYLIHMGLVYLRKLEDEEKIAEEEKIREITEEFVEEAVDEFEREL